MANMRTSTDDCRLVVGSSGRTWLRPNRCVRVIGARCITRPGDHLATVDQPIPTPAADTTMSSSISMLMPVRHVVRRHGQPLPALSDNTEAIPRSIRELVCVVQVEPYELAGEFLGALAVSAQALQPVGVSTVIRHRRRSSLIRCCGSTDPRLGSVPGDRGRARGSGRSSSRHLVLFPRCSRGVPPDGWDSESRLVRTDDATNGEQRCSGEGERVRQLVRGR